MNLLALLADILFIGHSLIGPTLPGMVERAAAAQGIRLQADMQIINGAPLRWNWESSHTAEGVDGVAMMPVKGYDHVVITEAIPLANHVEWSDTHGFARRFHDLAMQSNPQAQVWIYETWHSLDSGTGRPVPHDSLGDQPWRDRLDADWPSWSGIATAAGPGARVIPAGQAMARMADEIARGTVPGLADIGDLFSDDIHLNDRGLYFVAMVMHAAITGQDPQGLPPRLVRMWQTRATVTEPMALRMQQIAWDVVQDRLASASAEASKAAPAEPVTEPQPPPAPTPAAQPESHPPDPEPDIATLGGVRRQGLAFGLAHAADWTVQQPFLDIMKTARPWIGHLPGQWGGWGHDELAAGGWLDEDGWPRAIPPELSAITTLVLTDLPEDAAGLAGRYVLTHDGRGELALGGRGRVGARAPGRIVFDFRPGPGGVEVRLARTDPADPIRNIRILREDRAALLDGGALFNPDWLARIDGVEMIRFMDWMQTNGSLLARLEDRPRPTDYTWARIGVPLEVMVRLANDLRAHPWFTLPHLSEDALVRFYAETVHESLAPGLVAHVEYSNEVWNHGFAQARWAEEQGKARWGEQWKWVQFYALRAAEVAEIWRDVFRDAPQRLVRVLSTQTGWKGLEADILRAPLVIAEGRPAPHLAFDAWAVTAYISGGIGSPEKEALLRGWLAESRAAAETAADAQGLQGMARADYVARHRFDQAIALALQELRDGAVSGNPADSLASVLGDLLPYHAEVAQSHDLQLMMYEGGTHVVGLGPLVDDPEITAFLIALNYSDGMGEIYRDLLDGWARLADTPFNAFVEMLQPSRWGSWGALRHLGDDNPRWRALARGE